MSIERERTVNDLIDTVSAMGASSNAPTYERARAELTKKYVYDLISTIEKLNSAISNNSEASNVLAKKSLLVKCNFNSCYVRWFPCSYR